MNSKILIDTHIHTKGISHCSVVNYKKLVDICIEDELKGIVLTNHYKAGYYSDDFESWQNKYIDEYLYTKEYGIRKNFKVFFGVEITLDIMKQNDFVIYGLSPEDFKQKVDLTKLNLEELSDYVHGYNSLLFHAHPYRNTTPCDGSLVDGTEINCHPIYRTNAEKNVRIFADNNDLILTCGSDYHGDSYKARCGTYIPNNIESENELVEYFKSEKRPDLLIAPDPLNNMDTSAGKGLFPFSNEENNPNIYKILST